jgi:hypothetical protein
MLRSEKSRMRGSPSTAARASQERIATPLAAGTSSRSPTCAETNPPRPSSSTRSMKPATRKASFLYCGSPVSFHAESSTISRWPFTSVRVSNAAPSALLLGARVTNPPLIVSMSERVQSMVLSARSFHGPEVASCERASASSTALSEGTPALSTKPPRAVS